MVWIGFGFLELFGNGLSELEQILDAGNFI